MEKIKNGGVESDVTIDADFIPDATAKLKKKGFFPIEAIEVVAGDEQSNCRDISEFADIDAKELKVDGPLFDDEPECVFIDLDAESSERMRFNLIDEDGNVFITFTPTETEGVFPSIRSRPIEFKNLQQAGLLFWKKLLFELNETRYALKDSSIVMFILQSEVECALEDEMATSKSE